MQPPRGRRQLLLAGTLLFVLCAMILPSLFIGATPTSPPTGGEPASRVVGREVSAVATTNPLMGPRATTALARPPETTGAHSLASTPSWGPQQSPSSVQGTPPHPEAISSGGPPGFRGHYYAGSVYSGSSRTAGTVGVTLRVPDDRPEGGPANFYYMILSVWDDAGSYDQLGFANSYGSWGVAYSTTNYCATTYYYSPDAFDLQSGQLYQFTMSIASGQVQFTISNATSGAVVWTVVASTGGTAFLVQPTYGCDSSVYYDYTDYEEVYGTSGPNIPYDLFFANNTVDSSPEATWARMGHPARTVLLNGPNVTLENEPYYLSPLDGQAIVDLPSGVAGGVVDWNVSVEALNSDGPIELGAYHLLGGWIVRVLPSSGVAPFRAEATLSFPAGTPSGCYWLGVNASDQSGSGSYSRLGLEVNVGPEYTVAYEEEGLPTGTPWAIALNGAVRASITPTMQFQVPNGTFNSSVAPIPGYRWSPVGHAPTVAVSGVSLTETPYVFVATEYLVTFEETGLPSGIRWWVNATGGPETSSLSATLEYTVPNGSVTYAVSASCFVATPDHGTLSVTGRSVRVSVSFTNGTSPCLAVLAKVVDGGGDYSGTSLNFSVPGREPSYELILWAFGIFGSTPSYYPTPTLPAGMSVGSSLGYAGVAIGAAAPGQDRVVLPADGFTLMSDVVVYGLFNDAGFTYQSASASETGNLTLQAGAVLYLGSQATLQQETPIEDSSLTTVDSESEAWSTGYTNLVGRQNSPTFSMSTNASDFGTVAVGLYAGARHSVTFDETGLRAGARWSVTAGGTTRSTTGPAMTFSLFNGSYDYLIRGPHGARLTEAPNVLPPTGTLLVQGTPLLESVLFRSASTRSLTFEETGLVRGTAWCVTLGPTACTSLPRLAFGNLTPWSYPYSVLPVRGYTALVKIHGGTEPPSGVSNTSRGEVTVRVEFTPLLYGVSFMESHLSAGVSWHVRATCLDSAWSRIGCDGGSASGRGTASNLTLLLRNGTYLWKVSPVRGYELVFNGTDVWSGFVTVDGSAVTLYFSFLRVGSTLGAVPPRDPALTVGYA